MPQNPIEAFWDDILSRAPQRVKKAFSSLDAPTRTALLAHLRRMVSEEGWHPEQVASARAALAAITELTAPESKNSPAP